MSGPTATNPESWIETVWGALHSFRQNCIPEGDLMFDAEWDDICTAMAWISENLGLEESVDED